jgi:hypothetical protein
VDAIDLIFQPLSGQFARSTRSSDLVGTAQAKILLKPISWNDKTNFLNLYPTAGYEGGHNLNQPATLFKEKVDLSDWNGISRGVWGMTGEYYAGSNADAGAYVFTVSASYQSRILFEPEPFVTVADIKGTAVDSVSLSKGTRPNATVQATWNFNTYVGLTFQYKYGSLPPLFQFVDHQATIGLTLQAKQAK